MGFRFAVQHFAVGSVMVTGTRQYRQPMVPREFQLRISGLLVVWLWFINYLADHYLRNVNQLTNGAH